MSEPPPLEAGLRRLHLPSVRQRYAPLEQEARERGWSYSEYLERLVEEELSHRREKRIAQMVRRAGFPFLKTLEEFDFAFQQTIQRKMLGPYLGPELVSGGRSLILWGPSGVGKTALTIGLAYKAIQHGARALFVTCTELIGHLVQERAKGQWDAALRRFLEPEVLVIDEVGYLTYGPYAANMLFPVVDKRYLAGDRPMLLTTNKDPQQWGAVLHDNDLSAAILDRLLHRGEILKVGGRSYRQHRPGQLPKEAEEAPGQAREKGPDEGRLKASQKAP
jgi:DNA replication protein DnaC